MYAKALCFQKNKECYDTKRLRGFPKAKEAMHAKSPLRFLHKAKGSLYNKAFAVFQRIKTASMQRVSWLFYNFFFKKNVLRVPRRVEQITNF